MAQAMQSWLNIGSAGKVTLLVKLWIQVRFCYKNKTLDVCISTYLKFMIFTMFETHYKMSSKIKITWFLLVHCLGKTVKGTEELFLVSFSCSVPNLATLFSSKNSPKESKNFKKRYFSGLVHGFLQPRRPVLYISCKDPFFFEYHEFSCG